MPISTPAVWTDPGTTAIDPSSGGVLAATVFDNIAGNLAVLGGSTGGNGIAGKANLLVNGGCEVWQRGTTFVGLAANAYCADRWQWVPGAGSTVNAAQETSNIQRPGLYAVGATYTHAVLSYFGQRLENGPAYAGVPLALSVWVKTSTAAAVTVAINDGTQTFASAAHPGDGLYHQLTATGTLSGAASQVLVQVLLAASCTVYVDNAMLVPGTSPAPFVPLTLHDDLARCQRYYEVVGVPAAGSLVIQGYHGSAAGLVSSLVPWKVPKAVTPTVTKNGTWGATNCSQPIVSGADTWGCFIQTTATAAGSVLCQSTGAGSNLTAQADV